MKPLLFIASILLCLSCTKPLDVETEKTAITKLVDDETRFAAAADLANWATCWSQTDDVHFIVAASDGAQQFNGWSNIKNAFKDIKPFELKLRRDNYNFAIDNDVAFVSFDQYDNWGNQDRKTKESRALKKNQGQWKIVDTQVIVTSSYEKNGTGSFHIAKEKIRIDPRTSLRNQSGLGGMVVGYGEVPAGTDFTPLLAGLPQDKCPSPHWGYMLEGAIRIKYPDGKEDVVNAGEVFYWPAPHTGVVEKNAKFIDFSPEPEFAQMMDHIAKKIAEASAGK